MPTNVAKFLALQPQSLNDAIAQRTTLNRLFGLWARREVAIHDSNGEILAEHHESGFLKRHHGFFMPARELLTAAKQSLTKLLHQGYQDLQCMISGEGEEVANLRSLINHFERRSPSVSIKTNWRNLLTATSDWRTEMNFAVSRKILTELRGARPAENYDDEFDFDTEYAEALATDHQTADDEPELTTNKRDNRVRAHNLVAS